MERSSSLCHNSPSAFLCQQLVVGGSHRSAIHHECWVCGSSCRIPPSRPPPPSMRQPKTVLGPAVLGQESVAASRAANTCVAPALLQPARCQLGLRHGGKTRQARAEQMLRCGPGWVVQFGCFYLI